MQEWLNKNDVLMYSTHNEAKSVIIERFVKTLKAKLYKKMTANDSKSYFNQLHKLVNQYNNSYHHSINKKLINADYSALTEKIKTNSKAPELTVNDRVKITKYKNICNKGYTKNWLRKIFIIDSVLKTNLRTYKIKYLNGEKISRIFLKKELLLSIL